MFNGFYDIRSEQLVFKQMYFSYLSTQTMLIDITVIVTSMYRGKSSFYHTMYLRKFKSQNDMIWEKVDTTYFSHDHDLVAGKIKLFDSLPRPRIILECPLEYT